MGNSAKKCAEVIVSTDAYVSVWNRTEWVGLPDGSVVPAYLSCRRLLSNPTSKKAVKAMLVETAREKFNGATSVIGLATAGIVWGDAVADGLHLPFGYVRSEKKGYGLGSYVEGSPPADSECVLVDDTLHTGDSILVAANVLRRERNIKVIGALTIASLYSGGTDSFSERSGHETIALTDYNAICEAAEDSGILRPGQAEQMVAYYNSPTTYEFKRT